MEEQADLIRVAIRGAEGRMGHAARAAIAAADGLSFAGPLRRQSNLVAAVQELGADVVLDLTRPDALPDLAPVIESGTPVVVGTSGVDADLLADWTARVEARGTVLVVPNFCVGVVLLQSFAERAAAFYSDVEILEMHHEHKVDSPSATAVDTAERIARVRVTDNANRDRSPSRGRNVAGVPVHSVRLPGLLAHQVVLFGGNGETLTLRHDSYDRASFMPGVLLALRTVRTLSGLHVGLESCLPELGPRP